ncbi:MAG: helix-turn-helix domain-containing protein [Lachnospiraceae bacterium]
MAVLPLQYIKTIVCHSFQELETCGNLYHIAMCTSGSACYLVQKDSIQLQQGDIFLLQPKSVLSHSSCSQDFEMRVIQFGGVLAKDFLSQTGFQNINIFPEATSEKYDNVCHIFLMITNKTELSTEQPDLQKQTLLYRLLIQLHFYFIPEYNDEKQRQRTMLAPVFERIHNPINITELSLQELAELSGLSPTHLSRVFKDVTGKTPTQFMLQKRLLGAAKTLLEYPDMTVEEVGIRSGFTSTNYFRQTFKQMYHISPSGYREQRKQQGLSPRINFIPYWQPLYITNTRRHEQKAIINYMNTPPSSYRLSICMSGEGKITTEGGETYLMHRNEIYLNTPYACYRCDALNDNFRMLEICFDGVYAKEIMNCFNITKSVCFTNVTQSEYDFLQNMTYIWRNFWTRDKEALLECSGRIHEIIYQLNTLIQVKTLTAQDTQAPLSIALKTMELQYMNDLSISDLAEMVGLSYSTFSKDFKKTYGQSPKQYLQEYRLQMAADMLLKYPSMKTVDVAKQNGFTHISHFCKAFHERFGMPPQKYKEQKKSRYDNR